jgi:hypothetical protein
MDVFVQDPVALQELILSVIAAVTASIVTIIAALRARAIVESTSNGVNKFLDIVKLWLEKRRKK